MGGTSRKAREVTAAEAAVRLGMSRERLVRLIQVGDLLGRRDGALGWLVSLRALQRLERAMRQDEREQGRHHG